MNSMYLMIAKSHILCFILNSVINNDTLEMLRSPFVYHNKQKQDFARRGTRSPQKYSILHETAKLTC